MLDFSEQKDSIGIDTEYRQVSLRNRRFKMEFRYNRHTLHIESDDPNISIQVLGVFKDGPCEYLLKYEEKRIGFTTVNPNRYDEDGSVVWDLEAVCVPLQRKPDLRDYEFQYANCFGFSNRSEQDEIVEIITAAMSIYTGNRRHSPPAGRAVVNLSAKLQLALDSGSLIKPAY